MALIILLLGFVIGVLLTLVLQFIYFLLPFDLVELLQLKKGSNNPSADAVGSSDDLVLPMELRALLTDNDSDGLQCAKESCISFSLLLQFLFQEFKNARIFKRWILKKLQIDFNELMSRSLIGNKIIRDINVQRLDVGSRAPVIENVSVRNVKMAENGTSFESLELLLTVKYEGGFALALDVSTMLGQQCSLSVSVSKLLGDVRLQFTRLPFTHWSVCFITEPSIDFNVQPTFRGRPMPHLIAVIMSQIRRTIRKRHVFPAYKLRFRPLIQHPLLQPSADPTDYAHIDIKGVLKLTIKKCSRLNMSIVPSDHDELFCVVTSSRDPFNSNEKSAGSMIIALKFVGKVFNADIGLTLSTKASESNKYVKQITVTDVKKDSVVERAGFKVNDRILAVNNIPITTDRQAYRLLTNTRGDVVSVVERNSSKLQKIFMDLLKNNRTFYSDFETNQNIAGRNSPTPSIDQKSSIKSEAVCAFSHKVENSRLNRSSPSLLSIFDEESTVAVNNRFIVRSRSTSLNIEVPIDTHSDNNSLVNDAENEARSLQLSRSHESPSHSVAEPLTRRQKLLERANYVAHKISTGKNHVKQRISRRIGKDQIVTPGSVPSTPITALLASHTLSSASGLCFTDVKKTVALKRKLTDIALDRAINTHLLNAKDYPWKVSRRRSNSEPQMAKAVSVGDLNEGSNAIEDQRPKPPKSYSEVSKSVKLDKDVAIDHTFKIPLSTFHRYVTIRMHSRRSMKNLATAQSFNEKEDILLGYVNLLIPEILDDCSSTRSLTTIQNFTLRPSNSPIKIPSSYDYLTTHAGFDGRLCYGDVTLCLQWLPDDSNLGETVTSQAPVVNLENYSKDDSHHWMNASFSRGTLCDVCQRKIWLKSALKCDVCSMICHKKCVAKSSILRPCGQIFENSAREDVDGTLNANDEGIEACESMDFLLSDIDVLTNTSDSNQSSQVGYGRRLKQGLSEKIAGLRRRRAKTLNSSDVVVTSPTKIISSSDFPMQKLSRVEKREVGNIIDSIEGNRAQFNIGGENSDNTSLLYTKCGTYNEHMIYAAKDLGKDLFSDMVPEERKKKINEEIDRLQSDIDSTIQLRLQILRKLKEPTGEDRATEVDVRKIDDELQILTPKMAGPVDLVYGDFNIALYVYNNILIALAILMLHYCAGLQNCIDMEEAAGKEDELTPPENAIYE